MDSSSRLDYALFQLTPTRTRCDLVICAGDCKEKLASGLFQPFLSHLEFAKDEISRGGYSVTLSSTASWFTKSTLERFVRFVSTPEVLERFIKIEREIANIDFSGNTNASSDSQHEYRSDEHSNKSANLAYKHESDTSDAIHDEDSKVHLQRVLKTRKAVLQREQAMVYARALIAGFETDNLQDLICFADAFGSPRLREACLNFIELCNAKSNDRVWMDEVAAMQAYPGAHYSYMEDDPVQGLRINVRNGNFTPRKQNGSVDITTTDSSINHGSHVPQYMHQAGPMFYPFPSMPVSPYYQANLPWPSNVEDSRSREERSHKKGHQDANFDSSDSSSGSESDSYEKSSSRKFIIRNINYVTSERDGKTERQFDDNSLNDDVNNDIGKAVDDKREGQKVTHHWDIFQNLLMQDADDKESDKMSNIIPTRIQPEFGTKASNIGKHNEGDWFSGGLPEGAIQDKSRDIFEDNIKSMENSKDVLVNDPLAVQTRSLNQLSDFHLKTRDILMVSESNQNQKKVETTRVNEPNDRYMVLERDTSVQQAVPTWTPEMESGYSNVKIIKPDFVEVNKSTKSRTKTPVVKVIKRKGSTIEAKSKALTGSRSEKTAVRTTIPKGIAEKEEDKRKKMEELLARRQKRIAERSALTTKTAKTDKSKPQFASQDEKKSNKLVIRSSTIDRLSTARVVNPKVLPTESKPSNKPMKAATKKNGETKPGNKPMKAATKKNGETKPGNKPMKAATKKNGETKPGNKPMKAATKKIGEPKPGNKPMKADTKKIGEPKLGNKPMKAATKKNGEPKLGNKPMKAATKKNGGLKPVSKPARVTTKENVFSRTSLSQRTPGAEKKKVKPDGIKPRDRSIVLKSLNGPKKKIADVNNIKHLPKASPINKIGNQQARSDNTKGVNKILHKGASSVLAKDKALSDGNARSAKKALNSVSFNINEENGTKENPVVKVNGVISVSEISPQPPVKASPEENNSKKKWNKFETTSKALRGFRKLLSFGKRG